MKEFISKLLKLKPIAKVGVTFGVMVLLGVAYQYMFYLDLSDEIQSTRSAQARLTEERASYERRKQEYLAYRNELVQLQEERRELLKVLPRKAEVPNLLSNIEEQAQLAGVEVLNLVVDKELPEELYVRIPIKMEILGSYHSSTRFFKNVSDLRRIINVENVSIVPVRPTSTQEEDRTPSKVKVKFTAFTFRLPDEAAAGGGT